MCFGNEWQERSYSVVGNDRLMVVVNSRQPELQAIFINVVLEALAGMWFLCGSKMQKWCLILQNTRAVMIRRIFTFYSDYAQGCWVLFMHQYFLSVPYSVPFSLFSCIVSSSACVSLWNTWGKVSKQAVSVISCKIQCKVLYECGSWTFCTLIPEQHILSADPTDRAALAVGRQSRAALRASCPFNVKFSCGLALLQVAFSFLRREDCLWWMANLRRIRTCFFFGPFVRRKGHSIWLPCW